MYGALLFLGSHDVVVALDLCDGDVKFGKVKFAVAVQVHALHQFGCFH